MEKKIDIPKNIDELLSKFHFEDKNKYKWNIIAGKIEKEKNKVYCGTNPDDKNDVIYVKQIFIKYKDSDKYKHTQIFKEIYLLFSLKKYDYFPKNVETLFSDDEEFLFIIFRNNNINLKQLIKSKVKEIENPEIIKWIIYQIAFGLYTLHANNIIHHDIKPPNILIDSVTGVSICDFGSAIIKGEDSYEFTLSYASPEYLIKHLKTTSAKIDEKYDMWALGITMLEIFLGESIFNNKNNSSKKVQLKNIYLKFGINEDYIDEVLLKELNENINIEFKFEEKILKKIKDKSAIELLKKLITFNPKERYSAKEVLNSDYLKDLEGLDSFEINLFKFPEEYSDICKNPIEHKKFVDLIRGIN